MTFSQSADGYRIQHLVETNSTNDDILTAIEADEPEGLVIVADRQLNGRGRQGRIWVTTPDSSLAFSILLRPSEVESAHLSRFSALAGLAVIEAIAQLTGVPARLKWPNDVLINGKKICGILAEAVWEGSIVKGLAIGIGINIRADSVPELANLIYPISSLESESGIRVDRATVLEAILQQINSLRSELASDSFIERCNDRLAFKGQTMPIRNNTGEMESFRLLHVDIDGALIVSDAAGLTRRIYSGELSASSSSTTSSSTEESSSTKAPSRPLSS